MAAAAVVLSTCGSRDEALKIAEHLVEQHLCACTNIVAGVESIYRWRGQVERSQEWLLIIKTRAELTEQVQQSIRRLHSYETPEAIVLLVTGGFEPYLRWIADETKAPDGQS